MISKPDSAKIKLKQYLQIEKTFGLEMVPKLFGLRNPKIRLLFVGESFAEDARQLLAKIIEAMKFKSEEVSITPSSPLLAKQIEAIRPEIICALGKFAAQTLLATDEPISRLRGQFYDFNGVKLMPTFDPAYLLQNPDDKKLVWEDMQKIMKELAFVSPSSS